MGLSTLWAPSFKKMESLRKLEKSFEHGGEGEKKMVAR